MWLLPVLDRVCSVAARSYYRLYIEGENVPSEGPVLLVANHPNSLFDPALVAAAAGRPVRFLAKEPLLHHPGIGWLIRASGAIPIYRMKDDPSSVHRNDESFRAAHAALAGGSAIGMFPEGISHHLPALAPLKTGAARIALGAARQTGRSFPIVPIGLTFRGKEHFRSDALVLIGQPIEWEDLVHEQPSSAQVRELTRRIAAALHDQTLNVESWEDAPLVEWAAAIYAAEEGADEGRAVRVRLEREASLALERLRLGDADELRDIVLQVEGHARVLQSFGLRPADLREVPKLRGRVGRTAGQAVSLFCMSTLGILGRVLFYVPTRITTYLTEKLEPTPDVRSTYLTLGGALFGTVWIALLAIAAAVIFGMVAAAVVLVTLPCLAIAAVVFRDRWSDARAVARRYLFLRSRRELHRELARHQADLARRLVDIRSATDPESFRSPAIR